MMCGKQRRAVLLSPATSVQTGRQRPEICPFRHPGQGVRLDGSPYRRLHARSPLGQGRSCRHYEWTRPSDRWLGARLDDRCSTSTCATICAKRLASMLWQCTHVDSGRSGAARWTGICIAVTALPSGWPCAAFRSRHWACRETVA